MSMAVKQQHISRTHLDLAVLANVGHFYVIVPVRGEVRKARMAAQSDLLTVLHQAMAVDNKLFGKGGIKAFVHAIFAL